MALSESLYETALRGARPLFGLAGAFDEKIARGLAARRGAAARLLAWARAQRDPARPLFWFHSPSVGEALMAQATIRALKAQCGTAQIAFTFFSPSAERVADRMGADVHDVLPWDLRSEVGPVLDALRPSAIAFVRTEVWPVLSREAALRGVRMVLINAVLGEQSSRLREPARTLLAVAYRRLGAAGAAYEEDARLLQRLGVPPERIHVTGDARFDQVWDRVTRLDRAAPLLRGLFASAPLVVAGSTWPPDEDRLIVAFARLRVRARARLVIAPHEPTPDHLGRLEESLAASGLEHERLGAVERAGVSTADVIVVDRVGVLADLYAAGTVAFVGGGFGRAGLHSVIEPAALGIPVLVGPRHGNAREAAELVAAGGGLTVSGENELTRGLELLFEDADARARMGAAAAAFVRARLGAAARNAGLVLGVGVECRD